MKKVVYLLSIIFLLLACRENEPEIPNIPMETMDEQFKAYLLFIFDLDKDGFISIEEAELVEEIDCAGWNISSLEGIQNFPNLTKLDCSGTSIHSIDLSRNTALKTLICGNTPIQELDVSTYLALELLSCKVDYGSSGLKAIKINPELKILDISGHEISSLDFSGNKSLKELYCRGDMITLDVSNSVLDSLDCRGTRLVSLNLDGCATLKSLNCANTGNGFSLDLSHCTNLEKLYTGGIKDFDVSNLPLLKTLHYWNSFSFLDLTNNPELEDLRIAAPVSGEMGRIDLSNNYQLSYFSTGFSSYVRSDPDMYLDLSNRKALKSLSFSWAGGRGGGVAENSIKNLNLSGCTSLESINIEREPGISGHIHSLDVSGCITLSELNLYDMQLSELNQEGCSNLVTLDCGLNQLTKLNLNGCTNLLALYCRGNQLTALDLSECTKLTDLICNNNKLNSLKTNSEYLSTINCSNNALTKIDIHKGIGLLKIDCSFNRLTALNLTGCLSLKELDCRYNDLLVSLNIDDCELLETLVCSYCSLTTLDFSHCTALSILDCSRNSLQPSLDVSNCHELSSLSCTDNPDLEELILYRNHSIKSLSKDAHTQIVLAD